MRLATQRAQSTPECLHGFFGARLIGNAMIMLDYSVLIGFDGNCSLSISTDIAVWFPIEQDAVSVET